MAHMPRLRWWGSPAEKVLHKHLVRAEHSCPWIAHEREDKVVLPDLIVQAGDVAQLVRLALALPIG
jgi:hypothetical protein